MRWRTSEESEDRAFDLLAAAGLLALGLFEAATAEAVVRPLGQALLTMGWTLPLIWRRRWPVLVLAVVVPFGPTLDLVNSQGGVISYVLAVILAAFTVGRECGPPHTWWGPVFCVGFFWIGYGLTGGVLSDYLYTAVFYGSAWGVGHALRQRAERIVELHREGEDLRQRQAEQEQRAIAEERARIARELHDIVSHSISVITIQSQAVRRRLHADQVAEINDLRDVEDTARQAMVEMRRLLGVLRADGPATRAPQPGLDQLARLLTDTCAAGVPVELRTDGDPRPLPPGLDLAAYRIVQEALTNCRKHAAGAAAIVFITNRSDGVELRIENDAPAAPGAPAEAGHGLIGMRERVSLYGGTLQTGPRPGGGFSVYAHLPLGNGTGR